MTTFEDFKRRTKMRHDFSDQIQVRYQHPDGENIDTWVSGEEVLSRLYSESEEKKLRSLDQNDWKKLLRMKDSLPEKGKELLERHLRDKLADQMDDFVGESILGDSIVVAIKGDHSKESNPESSQSKWKALLQADPFREKVIELAWIQLEGSLPEDKSAEDFDDWT